MRLDEYVALADAAKADTTPYKMGQVKTLRNILEETDPEKVALAVTTHAMEHFRLYKGLLSAGQTYQALYDEVLAASPASRAEEQLQELYRDAATRKGPVLETAVAQGMNWEDVQDVCAAMVKRALVKWLDESREQFTCATYLKVFLELSRAVDSLALCAGTAEDGQRMQQVIRYYYIEGNREISAPFTSRILNIGETTFFRDKKKGLSRLSTLLFTDRDSFLYELKMVRKEMKIG